MCVLLLDLILSLNDNYLPVQNITRSVKRRDYKRTTSLTHINSLCIGRLDVFHQY